MLHGLMQNDYWRVSGICIAQSGIFYKQNLSTKFTKSFLWSIFSYLGCCKIYSSVGWESTGRDAWHFLRVGGVGVGFVEGEGD